MDNSSISSFQTIIKENLPSVQIISQSWDSVSGSFDITDESQKLSNQISATVSFQNSTLLIKTDYSNLRKDPFEYKRHYLVFYSNTSNSIIQNIIQKYFKFMEVGDMIKIVGVQKKGQNKHGLTPWIQKTKNNRIIQSLNGSYLNLKQIGLQDLCDCLTQVFKEQGRYNNLVETSVFLQNIYCKGDIKRDTQNQILFNNLLTDEKCQFFSLASLCGKQNNKQSNQKLMEICLIPNSDLKSKSLSEDRLQQQIKLHLFAIKNIKVKTQTVSIFCNNGSFTSLRQIDTGGWVQHQNKVSKTVNSLQCGKHYIQKLKIQKCAKTISIIVLIEYVKVNGDRGEIQGCFTIICDKPKESKTHMAYRDVKKISDQKNTDIVESLTQINFNKDKMEGVVSYLKAKNIGGIL